MTMQFYNGIIGHSNSVVESFIGTDTEESFTAHLTTQPNDWYYRNCSITYEFNNLGHRCKNLDDIDQSNYILFTGCSNTVGIGLELEKTYSYIVADKLGCDYYNLALGATGIDAMMHNLSLWLGKIKERPKAIVIQWPNEARFLLMDKLGVAPRPQGVWSNERDVTGFISAGSYNGFFQSRKKIAYKFVEAFSNDINIVNIDTADTKDMKNFIRWPHLDYARDLMHTGIETNETLGLSVLDFLR